MCLNEVLCSPVPLEPIMTRCRGVSKPPKQLFVSLHKEVLRVSRWITPYKVDCKVFTRWPVVLMDLITVIVI